MKNLLLLLLRITSFFLDIPVIPDLDEYQEDDMSSQMAQAPKWVFHPFDRTRSFCNNSTLVTLSLRSVVVNRVATYRELDHDLSKHAPFATLVSPAFLCKQFVSKHDKEQQD